jgi:transposase
VFKSAKIRRLLDKGVSTSDIVKKLGVSPAFVYTTKWQMKKNTGIKFKKVRGKVAKAKVKAKKITLPVSVSNAKKPSKLLIAAKDMNVALELLKKRAEDKAAQSIASPLYGDRSEWEEKNFWWLDPTSKDQVNHPDHYTVGGIETIDYIEAKKLGYHLGNVVKYVSRAPHKGRHLEDLKKARWYLDREIENLEQPV